ncbi:MAG: M23 family metallopeptidase [Candidatus Dadabacteria bacterium]|nr:M23 family metallopeptidase [Candidatus Dadabacteria bacterium]
MNYVYPGASIVTTAWRNQKLKKRNDGLSFIVCCGKSGWTRSWGISRGGLELALGATGVFVLGALLSFFLSYSFYGQTENVRAQKQAEIDELLDAVDAMSHEIIVDKRIEDRFIQRVLQIEKQLSSMETLLSEKKRRRTPNIGGRGFRASDIGDDYFDALEKDTNRLAYSLENTPLGRPASGGISSSYGYRKSPFSNAREFHGGVDFRGKIGDSIVATAPGVIEQAGRVKDYGNHVVIRHKKGYKTLYAHLSKIDVTRGQKIEAGEKIGELGSTGRSTGPHLHYEIIRHGKRINPRKYIK